MPPKESDAAPLGRCPVSLVKISIMDFKKFLKPLAGIALGVAAFASCAVGVKNPVLVDAFEYSTSAAVTYHFSSTGNVSSVFNVVEEYEDQADYGYLKLISLLPSSITSVGFAFSGYTTTCIGTTSGGDFRLYSGFLDGVPFVSLDVLNSSGGIRDVFSLVVVDSNGLNIVYVSDPESWKTEYGAAAVYQWDASDTAYIYVIRSKDFVSFENLLNTISDGRYAYQYEFEYRPNTYDRYYARGVAKWGIVGEIRQYGVDWNYPDLGISFGHSFQLSYDTNGNPVFIPLQSGLFWEQRGTAGLEVYGWTSDGSNFVKLVSYSRISNFDARTFEGLSGYNNFELWLYANPNDLGLFSPGYSAGYNDGYYDASSAGAADAFSSGYSAGYADGYGNGFHDGDISAQGISWNFFSMLSMVFSAPFTIIVNSFDFTFFEGTPNAFNFGTFFWGMFSLLLAFAIFKIVWGFIAGGK